METWLREVNESFLALAFLVLLMGAAHVGYRLAQRQPSRAEAASQIAAVQGAVFGLLALLLAFTFSLAISRFDTRKEMLRDEANAIGTTYLRAQLLPEPMRSRVPPLLRAYVGTRFELHEVSFVPARLREVSRRSGALHTRLWEEAVAASRTDRESKVIPLFVMSLNEMIDMHAKHLAAIRNLIPPWLFMLLFAVALVALGVTGYGSGPNRTQAFVLNALMALVITAVTMLIFDLHRPARGFIRVDMAPMVDLRDGMGAGSR